MAFLMKKPKGGGTRRPANDPRTILYKPIPEYSEGQRPWPLRNREENPNTFEARGVDPRPPEREWPHRSKPRLTINPDGIASYQDTFGPRPGSNPFASELPGQHPVLFNPKTGEYKIPPPEGWGPPIVEDAAEIAEKAQDRANSKRAYELQQQQQALNKNKKSNRTRVTDRKKKQISISPQLQINPLT